MCCETNARLELLWETLNATSVELNEEAGQVIDAPDRLDQALGRVSLYERVTQRLTLSRSSTPAEETDQSAPARKARPRRRTQVARIGLARSRNGGLALNSQCRKASMQSNPVFKR
jgi:hypothetical protein